MSLLSLLTVDPHYSKIKTLANRSTTFNDITLVRIHDVIKEVYTSIIGKFHYPRNKCLNYSLLYSHHYWGSIFNKLLFILLKKIVIILFSMTTN